MDVDELFDLIEAYASARVDVVLATFASKNEDEAHFALCKVRDDAYDALAHYVDSDTNGNYEVS